MAGGDDSVTSDIRSSFEPGATAGRVDRIAGTSYWELLRGKTIDSVLTLGAVLTLSALLV
jgi:hypothetical protein